jgi:hypothetical protein
MVFDLAGDDKMAVQIHRSLMEKGFSILSFTERRKDISDIFMEVSNAVR